MSVPNRKTIGYTKGEVKYKEPVHYSANQTAECFNFFLDQNSAGSIRDHDLTSNRNSHQLPQISSKMQTQPGQSSMDQRLIDGLNNETMQTAGLGGTTDQTFRHSSMTSKISAFKAKNSVRAFRGLYQERKQSEVSNRMGQQMQLGPPKILKHSRLYSTEIMDKSEFQVTQFSQNSNHFASRSVFGKPLSSQPLQMKLKSPMQDAGSQKTSFEK